MSTKKIIIWCLVLLGLLNPVSLVHAEDGSEDTIDLIDTFYVTTTQEDHTLHVPFSSSWFDADARVYNHDLAKASLGLATSAFRPNPQLTEEGFAADHNVRSFLEQAGFTGLRSDDYDKNPSMYTVSTVMGHQTVGEGDGAFELIAVGICGQGYDNEWESNLSIGTGKNPEGFSNAAHLVYDRVFGYISENHLRGKIKIWLSGFSRAAAVSNITASLLSDSDIFSQETVFAYTFATPMTVRDTEPKRYGNIFNICGKMDPVPQIPFADWGYSRYGVTYFTPTMETDSDFWEKREKADKIYKDITGISYWANPDMNSQVRVLMDCILNVCPNVEAYQENLQEDLISIWDKHDPISLITRLLKLADAPILINDKNRQEANALMNQIAYLILDYAKSSNSFRRYNEEASLGSNFLQTHTPELYVSWVFSVDDPAELYSASTEYTQLYVIGDADVTILRENVPLETLESGILDVSSYHYLGVRDDKITVLIPRDREYTVSIRSNRDRTVKVFEGGLEVGRHSPKETMTYTKLMKKGEVMEIGYMLPFGVSVPEDTNITYTDYQMGSDLNDELMRNVYSYQEGMSWRDMVLSLLIAAILSVTSVLFVVTLLLMWLRHRNYRKRGLIAQDVRFRPLPIVCFFLIQQIFLTKEFYTALYSLRPNVVNLFKIVIGLLILVIAFYGYRRKRDRFHKLILFSVILLTGADIMMTTSIEAGAVLYIAGYVLLCVNFIKENKPGAVQILIWIALSAAGTYFIMRIPGEFGHLRFLAVLYVIAGAALIVAAFTHSVRTSQGSFLLVAAGILIVLDTARGSSFAFHLFSAALHYIALSMLASTGSGVTLQGVMQEPAVKAADACPIPDEGV